jgi:TonB family protein
MRYLFVLLGAILCAPVIAAQDDLQLVYSSPTGDPLMLRDNFVDAWRAPVEVYTDADVEELIPDITPGWLQWNADGYRQRGRYYLDLYTWYKNDKVCLRDLLSAAQQNSLGWRKACAAARYRLTSARVDTREKTILIAKTGLIGAGGMADLSTWSTGGPAVPISKLPLELAHAVTRASSIVANEMDGYSGMSIQDAMKQQRRAVAKMAANALGPGGSEDIRSESTSRGMRDSIALPDITEMPDLEAMHPAEVKLGSEEKSASGPAVSSLTLDQARDQVHQLEQQIADKKATAQQVPPKDMFESTVDYEKRKKATEAQFEAQVLPLKRQILVLRGSTYLDRNVRPAFVTYDADAKVLTAEIGSKQFRFLVGIAEAKQMHGAWSSITAGFGYSDIGEQSICPVLLWQKTKYSPTWCPPGTSSSGDGLFHIGGQVTGPIPLNSIEAQFSDEARREKIQGVVLVSLIVDAEGYPQNPRVVRPLGKGLDEKAIEAVRKYRFKPAMIDNATPVPVMITVEVNFRLY